MKKKVWIAVVVVVILAAIGGSSQSDDSAKKENAKKTEEAATVAEEKEASVEEKTDKKEEKKEEAPKTAPYSAELTSGYYTAGIDFPAGTYQLKAISGNGNVSSSNMYTGGLNAMMGVDDPSMYQTDYSNIDLSDGVVLNISGGVCLQISSDAASSEPLKKREQPNTETISLGNGNFTAGTNFPAGVYDIVATGGSGNVSSSNLYEGGINAIMGTDNPSMDETEYKHITLDEGVILTIDGVQINLVPSN